MHGSDGDSVLSEPLGPDTLEAGSMVSAPDAFETLAIPTAATDYGRAFGSGRKLISLERNHLGDGIIEATECLKAWWDSGIIKQLT